MILMGVVTFMAGCSGNSENDTKTNLSLYDELDAEIAKSEEYDSRKQYKIESLKQELRPTLSSNERLNIFGRLVREYEAYNADSALRYVSLSLMEPVVANTVQQQSLLIKRADIFGHAGLFSDALETMAKINRDSLPSALMEQYYSTYCSIYQYLSEYTNSHETESPYETFRTLYADSIRQVADTLSLNHQIYVMAHLARNGDAKKAIEGLTSFLARYPSGTREYSILASVLSDVYKNEGVEDKYKYYLALSAISDVKGSVKENMSFREMATIMFKEGDIERANSYLKKSVADANFYSALMRNAQSARLLPVIDNAYASSQKKLQRNLRGLVIATAILSGVLVVMLVFVLLQFFKVRKEHCRVNALNDELKNMTNSLESANAELKNLTQSLESANRELKRNSRVKEQYGVMFMEYCSAALTTLEHYQKSLRRLMAKNSDKQSLLKKLESTEMADEMRKNFYVKFDEAILNLFPTFIEKINSLLLPGHEVTLKPGEILNTELRVCALIRMGIEDPTHIADFLQCSLTTVYTYRSKLKKRSVDPENFENKVRNIE